MWSVRLLTESRVTHVLQILSYSFAFNCELMPNKFTETQF